MKTLLHLPSQWLQLADVCYINNHDVIFINTLDNIMKFSTLFVLYINNINIYSNYFNLLLIIFNLTVARKYTCTLKLTLNCFP